MINQSQTFKKKAFLNRIVSYTACDFLEWLHRADHESHSERSYVLAKLNII